jgi:hypothetical protein
MTTDTFADFAASQETRKETADLVLTYTLALCEALEKNYIDFSISAHQRSLESKDDDYGYHDARIRALKQGMSDYEFTIETGRKYHKIIMNTRGNRSAHAFVDKKTGEMYKTASWKAPAKGVRYNLLNDKDREWLFQYADWASSYLYRN